MRLIDADKYCDFLNTYPLEKAQNNFMSFYRKALQNTYTFEVKAIPVEWIEKYAKRCIALEDRNYFAYRGFSDIGEAILNMLEEWKGENE